MPAKKKKPVKKNNKIVHAQVGNPILVRKTILEGSILSIENLKILRNIKRIKKLKNQLKNDLRKQCREMQNLIIDLEDEMPHPQEITTTPQKETAKEAKKEAKLESRKRGKQERLKERTIEKEFDFEREHLFESDIDKLKEKIERL